MSDFAGKWNSTFGPMDLAQTDGKVTGNYSFRGVTCAIDGELQNGRLSFVYEEPTARGEGWFELKPGGRAFVGQWRPEGDATWRTWVGSRVGFDGLWMSDFGRMRLVEEADGRVHGFYELGGGSAVEGHVSGNELKFTYTEAQARGEGRFVLADDGRSFQGEWHQEGRPVWMPWQGVRLLPSDVTWLVVLEVPWHAISADRDYSFGGMLREFFSRQPGVRMRHRFFTNEAGLRRHCREVALIAEPVVLLIATHGMPQGIPLDGSTIDPEALGECLKYVPDLRLLHFSACLLMKDPTVVAGWRALAERAGFAVSGYTTSVDWAASAIIEFSYLELIMSRGLAPEAAAEQVKKLLPFAGDDEVVGGAFPPAGFRIVVPGPAVAEGGSAAAPPAKATPRPKRKPRKKA